MGVLILLMAAINFVNLMTARASRRSVEVGVRKLVGADRCDLLVQFIGEALIYAALAALIAMEGGLTAGAALTRRTGGSIPSRTVCLRMERQGLRTSSPQARGSLATS